MAELNFGLLNPPGSQSIGNAFVQGMDQAAAARAQENQNALSQYTLAKAKREDELTNQLLGDLRNAKTPEEIYRAYQRVGKPEVASKMQSDALTRQKLALEIAAQPGAQAKTLAQTGSANAETANKKLAFRNQGLRDMSNNPSDANIVANHEDAVLQGMMTQAESDAQTAKLLAIPLDQRRAIFAQAGAPAPTPQQPRQPNLAADLLIPGPDGKLIPNTALINVKGQLAVAGRTPRAEALPRTQQVTLADGSLGIVNMDTGAITPSTLGGAPVKGKPSAFAEKTAAQQKQLSKDLGFAITQLTDITKDGGLIDQSTGSGAGRLTDISAGFFGKATPGAIAIGKIAPVADLALKIVPRFEGPQSNKDTASYKEAAGQLADSSLPTEIRKEAGKVVLRIMQARKDQFVTTDMATAGAPAAAVTPADQEALNWAAANPNDPRAAQIRQKNGAK
jgi:hypothetical protein